jgi:hypothetical protein
MPCENFHTPDLFWMAELIPGLFINIRVISHAYRLSSTWRHTFVKKSHFDHAGAEGPTASLDNE